MSPRLPRLARALVPVAGLCCALAVSPGWGASARSSVTPLVRIPFPRDAGPLDPYSFEAAYPLLALVYDTLMWRDARGVPRPLLARSVARSDDGRALTIDLRRGVRFHDGTPLTAADVEFTFSFMRQRYHPRFTPQLTYVQSVDAEDEDTIVITLNGAAPGVLDQPLSDVPILPRHLWESLPLDRLAPRGSPVGSGPYRLTRHAGDVGYRFEANRDYFLGRPSVEAIEVSVMSDLGRMLRAFERGDIDALPVALPQEVVDRAEGVSSELVEGSVYAGTVLMFNTRVPPLDDVAVRRALASVIDVDPIASAAGGVTAARSGNVHPDSRWAPASPLPRHDPARAAAALTRPIPPLSVLAPEDDLVREEAGRRVVLALERAGVDATLEPVPRDVLADAVGQDEATPSFQLAVWTSPSLVSHDPDFLYTVFGADEREAPLNYSGYSSAAFERLADAVGRASTTRSRRRAVAAELRLLARDVPVIPLFYPTGTFAYRPSVYDGWRVVAGAGILDKMSFFRDEDASAPPASRDGDGITPGEGSGRIGLFGWAALALFGAAAVASGAALLRRVL